MSTRKHNRSNPLCIEMYTKAVPKNYKKDEETYKFN